MSSTIRRGGIDPNRTLTASSSSKKKVSILPTMWLSSRRWLCCRLMSTSSLSLPHWGSRTTFPRSSPTNRSHTDQEGRRRGTPARRPGCTPPRSAPQSSRVPRRAGRSSSRRSTSERPAIFLSYDGRIHRDGPDPMGICQQHRKLQPPSPQERWQPALLARHQSRHRPRCHRCDGRRGWGGGSWWWRGGVVNEACPHNSG